ncbi:MAG: hypothetical protein JXA60_12945 [Candidatus Coatesbacteria bacterium]|nr:hypothetical protein [Candidatus Coatesbacteria bacterium]
MNNTDERFFKWADWIIEQSGKRDFSEAWSFTLGHATLKVSIEKDLLDSVDLSRYSAFITNEVPMLEILFFKIPFPENWESTREVEERTGYLPDGTFFTFLWNVFGVCRNNICYYGLLPYTSPDMVNSLKTFSMMLDNSFRVCFSYMFTRCNQTFIHGAGIIRNNLGLIFTGKSGAGKSTVSGFSKQFPVISDDLLVVSMNGNYPMLLGCPFFGDYRNSPQMEAPLHAIFFLVQSRDDRIEKINGFRELLSSIMTLSYGRDTNRFYFDFAGSLFEKVPIWNLYFTKSDNFWKVIEERMPEIRET